MSLCRPVGVTGTQGGGTSQLQGVGYNSPFTPAGLSCLVGVGGQAQAQGRQGWAGSGYGARGELTKSLILSHRA